MNVMLMVMYITLWLIRLVWHTRCKHDVCPLCVSSISLTEEVDLDCW